MPRLGDFLVAIKNRPKDHRPAIFQALKDMYSEKKIKFEI